jgi:FKBP-type peptidyl-prolyl cis-trans isomerase
MEKSVLTMRGNFRSSVLLIAPFILLFSTSCNFDKKLQEQEQEMIASFIKRNNITVAPTATGLYYIETLLGDGPMASDYDSVYVNYKTILLSGQLIDQSEVNKPYGFIIGVGQSIPGFEEGIRLMHEGGKADFIIPSKLAYGREGAGVVIGSYTPLLMEVELVKVVYGPYLPKK